MCGQHTKIRNVKPNAYFSAGYEIARKGRYLIVNTESTSE